MYVLYNVDSYNVLDMSKYIKQDGDYYIVHRNDLKVKYRNTNNDIGIVLLPDDKIVLKDGFPLIFDSDTESVYPDPFYVKEEEIPDDGNEDDSGDSDEEKPMTVTEMRTKIKELEEQLAATKILLGVE